MQEDQILRKIIEQTYTLRDLVRRTRILKKYLLSKLFTVNEPVDQDVQEEMSWLASLGSEFYNQFNPDNVNQIFAGIEKKIEAYSPVTLYVAFEPGKDDVVGIGNWFRKNTQNQFIFDLKYDPTLIGGCAIVKNGLYKDYSLKAKLQENITEINSIIRSNLTVKNKTE